MLLLDFGFLHMSFVDVIDILVVGILIFSVFRWIRGSAAMNIFLAILFLFIIRLIASALDMKLLTQIMRALLDVGVLALVIIFQPEIRHFLIRLGSRYDTLRFNAFTRKLFGIEFTGLTSDAIDEITDACRTMSEQKVGALMVFANSTSLQGIIETGDIIDARIESRLIQNLFFKNSPLHDGALVIRENRLVAARCTLPNTLRDNLPANYGMRHKAAVGMSEDSDAYVLVVSEETGNISFVCGGKIKKLKDASEIKALLKEYEKKK